jgi:hypothetical protein
MAGGNARGDIRHQFVIPSTSRMPFKLLLEAQGLGEQAKDSVIALNGMQPVGLA